jgi:hypothetical protein
MSHKIEKMEEFHVLMCWMFFFEAEGFFRSVEVDDA